MSTKRIYKHLSFAFCLTLFLFVISSDNSCVSTFSSLKSAEAAVENYNPGDMQKSFAKALAAYYSGEYIKAISIFEKLADGMPDSLHDEIMFWRGECYFQMGLFSKAEIIFEVCRRNKQQSGRNTDILSRLAYINKYKE